ncbi:thioesterase [Catenulispora sp. NL8]|uniref:Thioesterase n=1 Tax=Catenulispora pinistramenti TaxID=2705254 RepID=A0ABS5KM75_9ACTN|nr:alpha/beta fold hydrolase [Catenulispora pinistramenti]MBS2547158.1 thioesterase [Catenulispora pinistramenti]
MNVPSSVEVRPPLTRWLTEQAGPGQTALFCLPPSGGGASGFRPWSTLAPDWLAVVPVRLPAREARLDEPALESVPAVVEAVLPHLEQHAPDRFALFGHSMGAIIAFELARELSARGRPPVRLYVSGAVAPRFWSQLEPGLSDRPIEEILDVLISRCGVPAETREHAQLIALMEPAVRGDLKIVESYDHRPGPALGCPITALQADRDELTTPEGTGAWAAHTRAGFTLRTYPGGHSFPQEERVAVVGDIVRDLVPDAESLC